MVFDTANPLAITTKVHGHSYRANAVGQVSSEVEVTLERKSSDAVLDLTWIHEKTILLDRFHSAQTPFWSGEIEIPAGARGSGQYRVVFTEYEQFLQEDDTINPQQEIQSSKTMAPSQAKGGDYKLNQGTLKAVKVARRIVYADTIEI